jgi:hypothetical protein
MCERDVNQINWAIVTCTCGVTPRKLRLETSLSFKTDQLFCKAIHHTQINTIILLAFLK